MSLEDFVDRELRKIYRLGRKTVNRIEGKPANHRMRREKPHNPRWLPKQLKARTNDDYFAKLIEAVFFVHTRATSVEDRLPTIHRYLDNYRKTSKYGKRDVNRMLKDPEMFRSRTKVEACVKNAEEFQTILRTYRRRGAPALSLLKRKTMPGGLIMRYR